MRAVQLAKAVGIVLLLFICTYSPAFLIVGLLRLPLAKAVPVIISVTLVLALCLVYLLSRHSGGSKEFGFRLCSYRYAVAAIALGTPVGWLIEIMIKHLSSGPAMPEMSLKPWMMILYFVVGAAVQEEVIFRGLLQTVLLRRFPSALSFFGASVSYSTIIIAVLFGLIHFEVNAITAAGAFVLGLLAGELRRRSGSLVPAIIIHAIFNVFSAVS